MIKKILTVALCICLISGISAMAAESTESENIPAVSEKMPMPEEGGRQGGGRGGMGAPPDAGAQRGEMHTMPEGEMPSAEMTPPQNSENAEPQDALQNTQPEIDDEAAADTAETVNEPSQHMQKGGMGGNMTAETQVSEESADISETEYSDGILGFIKTYSAPVISIVLLILAFVFVKLYKRKIY